MDTQLKQKSDSTTASQSNSVAGSKRKHIPLSGIGKSGSAGELLGSTLGSENGSWHKDLRYYYLFKGDRFVGYMIQGSDKSMYSGVNWDNWTKFQRDLKYDSQKKVNREHVMEVFNRPVLR